MIVINHFSMEPTDSAIVARGSRQTDRLSCLRQAHARRGARNNRSRKAWAE